MLSIQPLVHETRLMCSRFFCRLDTTTKRSFARSIGYVASPLRSIYSSITVYLDKTIESKEMHQERNEECFQMIYARSLSSVPLGGYIFLIPLERVSSMTSSFLPSFSWMRSIDHDHCDSSLYPICLGPGINQNGHL